MIRSMTGFAAVSREDEGERGQVTVKSVNHRFLDSQVKAPQALASIESRIKGILQRKLTRGRVELSLNVEHTTLPAREVVLDERLLDQVSSVMDSARERGLITGSLTVSDLLRIPQVME